MKIMTGPLCRAARALVQLTAEQVAEKAQLDPQVILDYEAGLGDPGPEVRRKLFETLELAGAVFIPENGGGAGVRLKYSRRDLRNVRKWEGEGGAVPEDDAWL